MFKQCLISLLVCLLLAAPVMGQTDSLLQVFDKELAKRPQYRAEKQHQIAAIQTQLAATHDPTIVYGLLYDLCSEYQSYSYDSAYQKVGQLIAIAKQAKDAEKLAKAQIKQAFILLSGGLFKEAQDSLWAINTGPFSDETKSAYFATLARSQFGFAYFYKGTHCLPIYLEKGLAHLDSAIAHASPGTIDHQSLMGLRALKKGDEKTAIAIYEKLAHDPHLTTRQLAIEAASLSLVYQSLGNEAKTLEYILRSAIADERSCVRENTAILQLAALLFEKKDYERASRYINFALDDANFYGARLRKIQILEILPIIKAQQLTLEQSKRDQLVFFSVLLGVLLLCCVGLIIYVWKQNQALQKKEHKLSTAYQKLAHYTQALSEADHIKEKYIGHFFQSNTKLINKVQAIFTKASKHLGEGKAADAKFQLDQFKAANEQKKLLRDFDQAFLSVFPTFVEQLNQFFDEKDHFTLGEERLLNTELRIFALLRLGVSNNEVIAKALNYSVNTIYAYKTKLRNKSLLTSEEFDAAVMGISSVGEEDR